MTHTSLRSYAVQDTTVNFKGGFAGDESAAITEDGEISVKAYRYDTLIAEKKIANVVWVKIDTEGFDPHVLRGMEGALKAKTILGGIQFEYHLHYPTTAQYMKQSIHA